MYSSKTQAPPASIAELAKRAEKSGLDRSTSFKVSLRKATTLRQQGEQYRKEGDLENAFIYLIMAANIILEKLPSFSEYHNLTLAQRENLRANGEDIQHELQSLKPQLVDRHEKWVSGENTLLTPTATIRNSQEDHAKDRNRDPREVQEREARDRMERKRREDEEFDRRERDASAQRRVQEQIDMARRRPQADATPPASLMPAGDFRRRESSSEDIARRVQEQAAERKRLQEEHQQRRDSEIFRMRMDDEARRRQDEDVRRHQEEEYRRRQAEEARRRQESEASAQWRRQEPVHGHSFPVIRMPSESPVIPGIGPPRQSSPLTSPARYSYADDSSSGTETDVEPLPASLRPSNGRPVTRSISYPPPLTTTSAPPPDLARNPIEYPKIMTSHQQSQGYQPSAQSMFSPPPDPAQHTPANSLLFQPLYSGSLPQPSRAVSFPGSQPLNDTIVKIPFHYKETPPAMRPQPSVQYPAPQQQVPYGYRGPAFPQPPPVPQAYGSQYRTNVPPPQPPLMTGSVVPPRPPKEPFVSYPPVIPPPPAMEVPEPPRAIIPETDTPPSPGTDALRVVELPSATLPRFLSIAAANTEKNMETCGLLLGTLAHNVFTITTLLIPQQSATSDSCTMEAEELVVDFQDSRKLLTLGWIHTHPTQSCFMSSLDLHTHCGFQTMIPESIAVVCAPRFKPHFGIFRLTDPPGLQTIQNCTIQETFHPHPPVPIYTDCGSDHVKLKDDLYLEISDLRH